MNDGAGIDQPFDGRIGVVGDIVLEDERAERAWPPLDRGILLDRDREPLQGAWTAVGPCIAILGPSRRAQRILKERAGERIDLRFHRLGPRDLGLKNVDRRERSRPEPLQCFASGQIAEVEIGHRGSPWGRMRPAHSCITKPSRTCSKMCARAARDSGVTELSRGLGDRVRRDGRCSRGVDGSRRTVDTLFRDNSGVTLPGNAIAPGASLAVLFLVCG